MCKDMTTGETWTLEELKDAYKDVAADLYDRGIENFEEYLEDAIKRDMIRKED